MAGRSWWNLGFVVVLSVCFGAAAFYLWAFTSQSGAAGQFFTVAVAGAGTVFGVTMPPVVAQIVQDRADAVQRGNEAPPAGMNPPPPPPPVSRG